ncbi:hypothetical protein Cgig2_008154 [Carnegiea gigantea]|uniref:Reverse transcriptase zinc-binding domain-containing protein n=1 Tax=Carnegiea gigantea TaxID=171969 RepID=A0A9Q1QV04_9CARY|nr:hypothetical protein Cgig2_008154 [Carnegiea gigantea]
MALGLKDAWDWLKLTEEEEEAVVCVEEESDERLEQISLCLWGRLLTENYFNVGAMKTVMKNIWKPAKGVGRVLKGSDQVDCKIKRKLTIEHGKKGTHAISKVEVAVQPRPQLSLLCFNCWGFGNSQAGKDLCGLIQRIKPSLVFLSETKLSSVEMRRVMDRPLSVQDHEFMGVYVDSRGRSGRLALLGASVEERLDRVCANIDWIGLFPSHKVSHLDEKISDHLPLLVDSYLINLANRSRRICFEIIWAEDKRLGDFIDRDRGEWRVDMLELVFLSVDVELIKRIPLSVSWPKDRIVWHYSTNGELTVRSAYHFIQHKKCMNTPQISGIGAREKWLDVWKLRVPPWIKLFAWRSCTSALLTAGRLAKRIPNSAMQCGVCGAVEETDIHALFQCPLASPLWEGTPYFNVIQLAILMGSRTCSSMPNRGWGQISGEEFIAIAWCVWTTRNKYLYEVGFVFDVNPGCWKINFDEAKLGEWGYGWGMVARDSDGDVVVSAVYKCPISLAPRRRKPGLVGMPSRIAANMASRP